MSHSVKNDELRGSPPKLHASPHKFIGWVSRLWKHTNANCQSGQALAKHAEIMEIRHQRIHSGNGSYPLLRPDYATVGVLRATITVDQRRVYKMHQYNTKSMWLLMAQAKRSSASAIVARFQHGCNPNGRNPGYICRGRARYKQNAAFISTMSSRSPV